MGEQLVGLTLEQIGVWCNQQNLRFHRDDAAQRINLQNLGGQGLELSFLLDTERGLITVVMPLAVEVKVGLPVLVTAANRLNLAILMGSFVAHPRGHVYYRASAPIRGVEFAAEGIDQLFRLSLGTVEGIIERFRLVALGEIQVEQLFEG